MASHIEAEGKADLVYPTKHLDQVEEGEEAGVVNALHGQSKEQLLQGVQAFVRTHQLEEHEALFYRASLVAQHPKNYETIEELSAEEKDVLTYEKAHKWHGPFALYFTGQYTTLLCLTRQSLSVRLELPLKDGIKRDRTERVSDSFEVDTDNPDLSFPQEFGIARGIGQPGGAADEWKVGFVNSAPYISASLAGVWRK